MTRSSPLWIGKPCASTRCDCDDREIGAQFSSVNVAVDDGHPTRR
jgi:hypothetical protein